MYTLILRRLLAQIGDDEPPAVAWAEEAARIAAGERAERIASLAEHPFRHRPELALALGDLASRALGRSPDDAQALAHLTLRAVGHAMNEPAIANQLILSGLALDSAAGALAVLTETLALDRRLDEATSALVLAKVLAGKGTQDPELEAALALAEASVAFALGKDELALVHLGRAREAYRELDDAQAEALVEVRRAWVLSGRGQQSEAWNAVHRARELDPEEGLRAVAVMMEGVDAEPDHQKM